MAERQNAPNEPAMADGSDDSGIQDSVDSVEVTAAVIANGTGAAIASSGLFSRQSITEFVEPVQTHLDSDSPKLSRKESQLRSSSEQATADSSGNKYYCGFGRCRPQCMQRFMDARVFTLLLCLNCFIEGALVSGEKLSAPLPVCQLAWNEDTFSEMYFSFAQGTHV